MRYVETLIKKDIWDTETGLVWRREPEPGEYAFEEALARASQVAEETGQAWRVPTVEELASLVDRSCHNPASTFPNMRPTCFWTSSRYVGITNNTWEVNFHDGSVSHDSRGNTSALRLVRNVYGPSNLVQL